MVRTTRSQKGTPPSSASTPSPKKRKLRESEPQDESSLAFLNSKTVGQLRVLARKNGILYKDLTKKAQLVEAISNAKGAPKPSGSGVGAGEEVDATREDVAAVTAMQKPLSTNEAFCALTNRWPARKQQIETLLGLTLDTMGTRHIFVQGLAATGKSALLKDMMQTMGLPHVMVSCLEAYTRRLLFEQVTDQLYHNNLLRENDRLALASPNAATFVDFLSRNLRDECTYLIFDRAEYLRDLCPYVIQILLRLDELTQRNVRVIMMTECPWNTFVFPTGVREPVLVHFPSYSKEEMRMVLAQNSAIAEVDKKFYESFLSLLLDVFYTPCRDLRELRHVADMLYPKFKAPIDRGEAKKEDTGKLLKLIQPYFKELLDRIYLREVSRVQLEKVVVDRTGEDVILKNADKVANKLDYELPFYTKYLMIAAYLASHNPAKFDVRFFSPVGSRARGRKVKRQKQQRVLDTLGAPKAFPVDRMLAIFYSILEDPIATTSAEIQLQISSLVSLNLLTRVSSDDNLSNPKLACNVPADFIRSLSKHLGFELHKYLYVAT